MKILLLIFLLSLSPKQEQWNNCNKYMLSKSSYKYCDNLFINNSDKL